MARYDRFYGSRYGAAYLGGAYPGTAGWGMFPGTPLAPFGAFGTIWPPYVPAGYGVYDRDYTPRRRPEESRTYGRGGDEAARQWAHQHGYDIEYTVRPRGGGGGEHRMSRYDRPYRRRYDWNYRRGW